MAWFPEKIKISFFNNYKVTRIVFGINRSAGFPESLVSYKKLKKFTIRV
jgi:hypothetical protein